MPRKNYVVEAIGNWYPVDGGQNNFKGKDGLIGYYDTEKQAIEEAKLNKDSSCEVRVTFTGGDSGQENVVIYETFGATTKAGYAIAILAAVEHEGWVVAGVSPDGFSMGLSGDELEILEDILGNEITRPMIGVAYVTEKGFELAQEIHANYFPNYALTQPPDGQSPRWVDTAHPIAETILKHRAVIIPAVVKDWSKPQPHDKREAEIITLLSKLICDRNGNRALACLRSAFTDIGAVVPDGLVEED